MIFTRTRNKAAKARDQVGAEEAHRMWRIVKHRYLIIDHTNTLVNFIHDLEFKLILNRLVQDWSKDIKILENELNKYSVPSPIPNLSDVNVSGNPEMIRDCQTARIVHMFLARDVDILIDSFRDAYVNDDVFNLFKELSEKAFRRLDKFIRYVKVKGWIDFPPQYVNHQADTQERIDSTTIFNLWHHLSFRYIAIHLTKLSLSLTNDMDFKFVLTEGIDHMQRQTKLLEKELLKYGVMLPERYPEVMPTPDSSEHVEDQYLFTLILEGMKNAVTLQAMAIKETITNDRLRRLFVNLVFEELDLITLLIKYGKLKGWVLKPPMYRP